MYRLDTWRILHERQVVSLVCCQQCGKQADNSNNTYKVPIALDKIIRYEDIRYDNITARVSVALALAFGYGLLERTRSNCLLIGREGSLATMTEAASSELTKVSVWVSSSPPRWPFPSPVGTGRR